MFWWFTNSKLIQSIISIISKMAINLGMGQHPYITIGSAVMHIYML